MSDEVTWRWGTGATDYTLLDASGRRVLELESTSPDDPEVFAIIAAAPEMRAALRDDAALINDLMRSYLSRDNRECPCCEERGGQREDGSPATHPPRCRLAVRLSSLLALLSRIDEPG